MKNLSQAALGVFDSGVGGLTVVQAINLLLPNEDIVYLGDTARVPYGSKSSETVIRFAKEDCQFLLQHEVKAIVIACNTATAHALPFLKSEISIPIMGVLESGVEAALAATRTGKIGIIGTQGTISSEAYQRELFKRQPSISIVAKATPLLVPLVEEGWLDHSATRLVVEEYMEPFVKEKVDTLVLACTHYPLLKLLFQEFLGSDVVLVDSALTCARHLQDELEGLSLNKKEEGMGNIDIYLTDISLQFENIAKRFLKRSVRKVEAISWAAMQ